MQFTKLCSPTLKQLFIEQLETMILSGQLQIGEKLPSERALAAAMQISRSVVNAGIADMADKGFLEIIPRSGTYVADYRRRGTLDTLVSIMKFNGGTLPDSEVRSILELRKVLIILSLELAIPRIQDAELGELTACSLLLHSAETPQHAAEIVFDFDHKLSFFSGNTLLPLIFYSFKAPIMTLWERYFRLYGYERMCCRTDEILAAIRARDTDSAVACISHSIAETLHGRTMLYNS